MKLVKISLKAILVIFILYIIISLFLWYFDFGPRELKKYNYYTSKRINKFHDVLIDEYYGIDTLVYNNKPVTIDWAMTYYDYSYNGYWTNRVTVNKKRAPHVWVKFNRSLDVNQYNDTREKVIWRFENCKGGGGTSNCLEFDYKELNLPADTFSIFMVEYEFKRDEWGELVRDSLGTGCYNRFDTIGKLTLVKHK